MDTILYMGAGAAGGDPLGMLAEPGAQYLGDGSIVVTPAGAPPWSKAWRFVAAETPNAVAAYLAEHPVAALLIDTRRPSKSHPRAPGPFAVSPVGELLDRLFPAGALASAIRRDRVIALLGDDAGANQAAYHFGAYRIGQILTHPSRSELKAALATLLHRPNVGRIAVCLAGGGIEGLLYEIGVLRAIETFLDNRSVVDFDLFCGISAGALLGAFLANGVGPDEIARGLAGQSARMARVRRRDLFDPNLGELGRRGLRLGRELLRGGDGPRGILSSLVRAVPSGIFAGDRLRAWLERELTRPGMSDRFSDLRRPLYVGATDQDTSQAVVFGEEGFDQVPIHRAVRASSALVPFYRPEKIGGRYYTDGGFSRTTNMRVAVRQGATLVILVDPLVPAFSRQAGYVYDRGGVFGSMQGLKALVNGRFDKAVRAIREMFPDVAFYLFRPEGDEMRILSGSPMKYFYRREIEEIAYARSVEKIRGALPQLARDFALHGVNFRDPSSEPPAPVSHRLFEPTALGIGL